MARPSFDDIIPPEPSANPDAEPEGVAEAASSAEPPSGNSIRDVSPVETKERVERRARRRERRQLPDSSSPRGTRSVTRVTMWGSIFLVVVLLLTGAGFLFLGKTTITVQPLTESITLGRNVVHTAYAEPETGEFGYTVVNNTLTAERTIAATGTEYVEERASGRITVFNTYSSASQRLITNTRFEAPDGSIYRVRNPFVVPGMPDENTPGRIEVTVYADVAGAAENVTDTGARFTIPGLRGDARYDAFYAQLAEPIVGGFVGERPVVDENALAAARTALRDELRTHTLTAARERAPANGYIFDNAVRTSFTSLPVDTNTQGEAVVREQMTVHAVSFAVPELADTLARTALATPTEGSVRIDDPSTLTFAFVNDDEVAITNDALIQFTLTGTAQLVWDIDTESLKQELVGKHSNALNTIMSGYPGIESARATIRPFWKTEFPSDISSIVIDIESPFDE